MSSAAASSRPTGGLRSYVELARPFTLLPPALGVSGEAARAIESQHQRNAHKYRVGSPAITLDVMPREVPGGWQSPRAPRPDGRAWLRC